jgi:hypothetical protein
MTGGWDPGRQVRFELGLEPEFNSETADVWEGARVNLGPFGVLVIYTREYLNEVDPDHDQVSVCMCELAVRVPGELAPHWPPTSATRTWSRSRTSLAQPSMRSAARAAAPPDLLALPVAWSPDHLGYERRLGTPLRCEPDQPRHRPACRPIWACKASSTTATTRLLGPPGRRCDCVDEVSAAVQCPFEPSMGREPNERALTGRSVLQHLRCVGEQVREHLIVLSGPRRRRHGRCPQFRHRCALPVEVRNQPSLVLVPTARLVIFHSRCSECEVRTVGRAR